MTIEELVHLIEANFPDSVYALAICDNASRNVSLYCNAEHPKILLSDLAKGTHTLRREYDQ
jgi:hypothetical protein